MTRKFRITIGGITYNVEVEEVGGQENAPAPVQTAARTAAPLVATAASAPAPVPNRDLSTAPAPVKTPELATAGDVVRAPLPGLIVGVKVEVGQQIKKGDVVLVLEAMKMENDIVASADGTVKEIVVAKGSAVSLGDALVVIG